MSVVTGPIIHVSSYRAYNPAVWVESSYRDVGRNYKVIPYDSKKLKAILRF
jgi:hypothetical protein